MRKGKRAFSSNSQFMTNSVKDKEEPDYNVDKNSISNIKARVISHKLVHGTGYNEDYIVYWVEVHTDYKNWILKKRYSEFYELNKKLSEKIPELNKLFPPKRLFKNSEKIVEERKECFNKYLQFLFKNINIFTLTELLDFIQIDQKIIELYIKKHTMVKKDQNNMTYNALKEQFNKMHVKSKKEKSKSVGESNNINLNGHSSLSTKINSKDEINRAIEYANLNKINNSIIESCDSVYEVDEFNTNYFSTLLDYEKSNVNYQCFDTQENINLNNKESGAIVIQEFLKNLAQNIDNKTDIVKSFEEFLKQRQDWPKFSNIDIIKLYVGNDGEEIKEKKLSFNLNMKTRLSVNDAKNFEEMKLKKNKNYFKDIISDKDIDYNTQKIPLDEIIKKGLFHYIGEFDTNVLLSISCLNLLVKLLDNEFNPEVELYLKLFRMRKSSDFQIMRLEDIIKYNKGGVQSTNNAIKLLSILVEEKGKDYIKKYLVKDENILAEFLAVGNVVEQAGQHHLRFVKALALRDPAADVRHAVRVLQPICLVVRMGGKVLPLVELLLQKRLCFANLIAFGHLRFLLSA